MAANIFVHRPASRAISINRPGDPENDFMLDEVSFVLIHVVQITGLRRRNDSTLPKS